MGPRVSRREGTYTSADDARARNSSLRDAGARGDRCRWALGGYDVGGLYHCPSCHRATAQQLATFLGIKV